MNIQNYLNKIFPEKYCPVCNKRFVPAVYHVYKIGGVYFCGWNCYHQRQRYKTPRIGGGNSSAKLVTVRTVDGEILGDFSAPLAAEIIGCSVNTVYEAAKAKRPIFKKYICENRSEDNDQGTT